MLKPSAPRHRPTTFLRQLSQLLLAVVVLSACAEGTPAAADEAVFRVHFDARLDPRSGLAEVEIRIDQADQVLSSLDLNAPGSRFTDFAGDGGIEADNGRVLWSIPEEGGRLTFKATIDSLRGNVHDARITDAWAVLRLDDLFPAARTKARAGARAEATLSVSSPSGWRFETPYGRSREPVHQVLRDRLWPRPIGWTVGGEIGVRRDSIANRAVAVAAPVGQGFRRQDMLAFLRWTLPTLIEVFPTFPERLLIVGSGVDMWRGGLSAPNSLYIHPDRPLISGNGTSTLLHELVHVAVGDLNSAGDDWLVEGLAEYYALEVLRRTGGISERRYEDAMVKLQAWAERDDGRLADPSKGADTAYAVLVIRDLANELTAAGSSLDALVSQLLERGLTAGDLSDALAALDVSVPLPDLPGSAANEETAE